MNNEVYNRVAAWNSKRYDRVYNLDLTVALLKEEFSEWLEAVEPVDQLDALCDVIYVAFGALWKLNLSDNRMQQVMHTGITDMQSFVDSTLYDPAVYIAAAITQLEIGGQNDVLVHIIALAATQTYHMGLSNGQLIDALLIVCDSNDSKSVKKTASDIKANDGDKGQSFIPPEPRLQALLDSVE